MTLLETPKKYYYHAGGLHSKFKRPWTRPVDFVAEIVVFSPAMRLMQKELAFKNVEAGGAVCIAFIAMLLQVWSAGDCQHPGKCLLTSFAICFNPDIMCRNRHCNGYAPVV